MPNQTYFLYRYRTRDLLIAITGLILLGTATILFLDRVLSFPNWAQYILLTLWITGAYFTAGSLTAKPAQFQMKENAIVITQGDKAPETIPLKTVKSFAFYQELGLYSLKITLDDGNMLSIIQFKWKDQRDFQAFLTQFEAIADAAGKIEKSETFYRSRLKVIISITLLIAYIAASTLLIIRGSFSSWPALFIYFYWIFPILFFLKMLKAK